MAGLFDDPQSAGLMDFGLGLLGASGPSRMPVSMGQAIGSAGQSAMKTMREMQAEKSALAMRELQMKHLQMQLADEEAMKPMKQKMFEAQLADMLQKQAMNKEFMDRALKRGQYAPATAASTPTPPGMGAASAAAFGLPPSAATPAPAPMGASQAADDPLSRIPTETVLLDLANNGGKDLGKLIHEANKPNMSVHGGFAVDLNRVKPGTLLPQLNTSQDGKTSMVAPGPDGLPTVSIPRGALESFGAYKGFDSPITLDTSTGQKIQLSPTEWASYQTTGQLPPRLPPAPSGRASTPTPKDFPSVSPSQQAARETERQAVLDSERAAALSRGDMAGVAAIDRERKSTQGQMKFAGLGTVGVSQSPADAADQAAAAKYKLGSAEDLQKAMGEMQKAGMQADFKISKYTQLTKLLGDYEGGKLSKSAMDLAQLGNSLGIKIDKNLPNKEAAVALSNEIALSLRNPSGGAGMPGAMSDQDRNFLASMTPQLAQTAEGRRQIATAAVALAQRDKDIARAARKYEAKYGRLDNGFYDQLSNWAAANPLFGSK